jgi:AmmeMemoRadiSam system protein A
VIAHGSDLPRVARAAVEAKFAGGPDEPPFVAAGELIAPHGVFVTVRTVDGELRGCQGVPVPTQNDVVWRTWHHARAAAFHDSRFKPVRAEELPRLRFEVSVLSRLEPVASPAELDPARYGVLIGTADGRRAVLLPAIEGIESVAVQLRIARRKGGIEPDEPIAIQRFTTQSFEETEPPPSAIGS